MCAWLNPDTVGSTVRACDWVMLQPLLSPHYVRCPGHLLLLFQCIIEMKRRCYALSWYMNAHTHARAHTHTHTHTIKTRVNAQPLSVFILLVCARLVCVWRRHLLTGLRPRSVQFFRIIISGVFPGGYRSPAALRLISGTLFWEINVVLLDNIHRAVRCCGATERRVRAQPVPQDQSG